MFALLLEPRHDRANVTSEKVTSSPLVQAGEPGLTFGHFLAVW